MLWSSPVGIVTAGEAPYVADAVTFDGSADWLTRGADFTSNTDGDAGIFSAWIKWNTGSDGNVMRLGENTGGYIDLIRNASNVYNFQMHTSGATKLLDVTSNSTWTVLDGWHHVCLAWDLSAGTAELYINGSDDKAAGATITSGTLDYTRSNWAMGGQAGGSALMDADVCDFYLNLDEFLDITSAANLQKFRSTDGKPVDLGADGSTPTGSQPILFLHLDDGEAAANFASNAGFGGGMTVNGALATASTSPTD